MKHEQGVTLIEILIALGILGLVAAVLLSGVALTYRSVTISQERVTAESLAKSQLESIKSQGYNNTGSYLKIDIPAELNDQGYDIQWPPDITTIAVGLQKIKVTIKRGTRTLFAVEDYKVDR